MATRFRAGSSRPVKITGSVGLGLVLTARLAAGLTGSYQWRRNGVNISGATSSTYTQTVDDDSVLITCFVSGMTYTSSAIDTTPPVDQEIWLLENDEGWEMESGELIELE